MTTDQLSYTTPEEASFPQSLRAALDSCNPLAQLPEGDVLLTRVCGDPFDIAAFLQRAKANGDISDFLSLTHRDHPDSTIYAILRPHTPEETAGGELQEGRGQPVCPL